MYYEYHLEDGTVHYNSYANIGEVVTSKQSEYCDCCGSYLGEYDTTVKVKYCVIKEGSYCNHCRKFECDCDPLMRKYQGDDE